MNIDITEDYVSFETAKLLKEKGFRLWCYKCYGTVAYHKGEPISFDEECDLLKDGLGDEIEYVEGGYLYDFGCDNRKEDAKVWAAPTLQMAMKWLREVHNIFIAINMIPDTIQKHYFFKPYVGRKIYNFPLDYSVEFYTTYEEACEAGIKYCLENLI